MTNLTENSNWESGVYQLETDDPVLGGAPAFDAGLPVTGHANAQAQQLANRTKYLKNRVDVDLANATDPAKGAGMVGLVLDKPNSRPEDVTVHGHISSAMSGLIERNLVTPAAGPLVESSYTVSTGDDSTNTTSRKFIDVSGATTATQPASGYTNAVDLTPDYVFMTNTSGHNQSTSGNDGRTGIYAHRTKLVHAGHGDLVANNASIRITGDAKPGATHWLANPAGVIINGTVIGEATGCYLNPLEFFLTDKPSSTAFNVTCVGAVLNLNRNHTSDTQSNGGVGQVWAGFRAQSTGTESVETILSGTGKFFVGVDLSMPALDFGTNKAAIAMKANDRVYFNASAVEQNDGTVFIRANWRATTGFNDYSYYDPVALRWKVVVGGVETFQVSNTQVTVPQVNCTGIVLVGNHLQVSGSKVVGTRVTGYTPFTGTTNITAEYDTATVTLQQLAQRVAGIQASLTSHGLIGA